jgi:hypothetical protein
MGHGGNVVHYPFMNARLFDRTLNIYIVLSGGKNDHPA